MRRVPRKAGAWQESNSMENFNYSPNMDALVKIAASVYDMYDHENYAERWNDHNPKWKKVFTLPVDREEDGGEEVPDARKRAKAPEMPLPRRNPANKNAPVWSKEQTHIYPSFVGVEGTGHGQVYGRPNFNNPYHDTAGY